VPVEGTGEPRLYHRGSAIKSRDWSHVCSETEGGGDIDLAQRWLGCKKFWRGVGSRFDKGKVPASTSGTGRQFLSETCYQ